MILRILGTALFAAATVAAHPAPAATGEETPAAPTAITIAANATVGGSDVRLGDVFRGTLADPNRVMARAPAPGQRYTVNANVLVEWARLAELDWKPAGPYDRVVVYRPGHTVSGSEIMDAIRGELLNRGMPANYRLKPPIAPSAVTIAAAADRAIAVREAYFDPAIREFSAIAEVPAGDPEAQFVTVRGLAEATVSVPVLNRNLSRNEPITAAMVRVVEISDFGLAADTIMDPGALMGKSPRSFVRSGKPLRADDVVVVTLVDIPVLKRDMRRGEIVQDEDVILVAMNADTLPSNAVTSIDEIVGKSPRQYKPSGAVIKSGDMQDMRRVEVPVATRDVRRGSAIGDDDIRWVEMPEADVPMTALQAPYDFSGKIAHYALRAGQVLREAEVSTPKVVTKGKSVTIFFETPLMKLSARGIAMQNGGVGETIRITNLKSNSPVMAEVISPDQVRVTSLQTAMN
ncbi:MAG: flagellar basal body P-ring formation protein FlgA [Alphaproteobacteria bacterium]|nr:flagellar basal body P-ring formation protein FlgA [Alphaproteobacteria bacterium]